MRRLPALIAVSLALAATNLPGGARADSCDDLTRQIAAAIGGKMGKRSGPSIDVRMSGPIKFDVTCRAEPIVPGDLVRAVALADLLPRFVGCLGNPARGIRVVVEPVIAKAYSTHFPSAASRSSSRNGWSASCYADPGSSTMRTLCSVGRIPPG